MLFNLGYGAGGAGDSMNFTVVGGTTAPSSATKNTIWVNTDTEITGYIFSPTEPTGSAGLVWIMTSSSGSVVFNALKENTMYIHPVDAKQYVSGAWDRKDAYLCEGSDKDQFSFDTLYLFDHGDITEFTGGWKYDTAGYGSGSSDVGTTLSLTANRPSAAAGGTVYLETNNTIDTSKYSKLHIAWGNCSYSMGSSGDSRAGVTYSVTNNKTNLIDTVYNAVPNGTTTIDISSISSLKLCFAATTNWYGNTGTYITLNINQIWFKE